MATKRDPIGRWILCLCNVLLAPFSIAAVGLLTDFIYSADVYEHGLLEKDQNEAFYSH